MSTQVAPKCFLGLSGALQSSLELSLELWASPHLFLALPGSSGRSRTRPDSKIKFFIKQKKKDFLEQKSTFFRTSGFRNPKTNSIIPFRKVASLAPVRHLDWQQEAVNPLLPSSVAPGRSPIWKVSGPGSGSAASPSRSTCSTRSLTTLVPPFD